MKEIIYEERQITSSDGSVVGVHRVQKQELVLCKDCKFRQSRVSRIIDNKVCYFCEVVKGYKPPEWFCADGKRNRRNEKYDS